MLERGFHRFHELSADLSEAIRRKLFFHPMNVAELLMEDIVESGNLGAVSLASPIQERASIQVLNIGRGRTGYPAIGRD